MIGIKLGWLGLFLLSVGALAYFGSVEALALAALLVLLPLLSLVVNARLRHKLELGVEAAPMLRKGDDGTITLWVKNPTRLPALRIYCRVTGENQLNGRKITCPLLCWAPPRSTKRYSLTLGGEYCGRIRLSLEKAGLYDCFGLLGLDIPHREVAHTVIQPDTFAMEVALLPQSGHIDESEDYAQDRPGQDLTETYQIREYVPGDSPRQIHWKLTGKFDKLIVRDPALPIAKNVLVFWERTGEAGDPERIDAQAEVVVSLCRGLADGGIPFTIGWNDTDRNLCVLHEIRDMDTLVGIIPRLLRATGAKSGISGSELLMQTGTHALCAHMVYIAEVPGTALPEMCRFGHVTTLLCGEVPPENGLRFTPEDYRRQLARLEL